MVGDYGGLVDYGGLHDTELRRLNGNVNRTEFRFSSAQFFLKNCPSEHTHLCKFVFCVTVVLDLSALFRSCVCLSFRKMFLHFLHRFLQKAMEERFGKNGEKW